MPNLIVTNRCNLKCPYCFAHDNIQDFPSTDITTERFQELVDVSRGHGRIGIIGGEPLTHPNIDELLTIINKAMLGNNQHSTLFTNGILLQEHMCNIGQKISILVNVNTPHIMSPTLYSQMLESLKHAYDLSWLESGKARIGLNLYHELEDISFFYDICKEFEIKTVRTSFVAPTYNNWANDREKYYTLAAEKFYNYCVKMNELNVKVGLDCNMVPECYFEEGQLEVIKKALTTDSNRVGLCKVCRPVNDVTPDGEAISCFGCGEKVSINKFNGFDQVSDYLYARRNLPLLEYNRTGRCKDCEKFDLLKCGGGCLAFAKATKEGLECQEIPQAL